MPLPLLIGTAHSLTIVMFPMIFSIRKKICSISISTKSMLLRRQGKSQKKRFGKVCKKLVDN